jgi:ferric-dicitrate binding protein FerR (iron transport regulator)
MPEHSSRPADNEGLYIPVDPESIDSYLAEHLSPVEAQRVESLLGPAKTIRAQSLLPASQLPIEADWTRLAERIRGDVAGTASAQNGRLRVGVAQLSSEASGSVGTHHAETSSFVSDRSVRRRMMSKVFGVGFGVGLLAGAWFGGIQWLQARMSTDVSSYSTAPGQRATITLPDGSTVWLNVSSNIEIPTNYAMGNRVVMLHGEALFNVMHNTGAPFTVLAGPSTTRVLGTSFVVRHYATDTAVTIAVRDGKVAVGSVVLTGGQETTVGFAGPAPAQITQPRRFAFAQGSLVIEDLALPAAIPELNRWYNADIRLGDPLLATHRMMGTYEAGSLADLISILELTFDVRVVREGRTLTLYPRG